MREYRTPEITEEKVEIEDVIALSMGGDSTPDNEPFFNDLNNISFV